MQLNTRYTLQAPDTLTVTGRAELNKILSRPYSGDWMRGHTYLFSLPEDFDYVWQAKGGKFTTRVAKNYYKRYGIKLPDTLLSEIGNVVRSHQQMGQTYSFEFVNEFDWEAGDYGDRGSCYWYDGATARNILSDNSALAIRFYDDQNTGIGRAWLAQKFDFWVLFNGYYTRAGNPTLEIAKVFAQFINQPYRKIDLYNGGRSNGPLWIDSAIGYVIGSPDKINGFISLDLEWAAPETCATCGTMIDEYSEHIGADGETYCDYCFYERFENCHECGEARYHDQILWVEDSPICQDCLSYHYAFCDKCDEYYRNRYISCPNCEDETE